MSTTSHCTEDQLVLHHYGEPDTEGIRAHLAECEDCRGEYARLAGDLALLDQIDELDVPRRGADYSEDVWKRVQRDLEPELQRPKVSSWHAMGPRLSMAATLAVLLIGSFLLGRHWDNARYPSGPISEQVRERILLVTVGDHLEQSHRLLIELVHAEGKGSIDLSSEQERAGKLASSNRLFRQTAARFGDPEIVDLLEELERTLLEVANSPATLASADVERLRRSIERRGILFKIRVLGGKVRRDSATPRPQPANAT